MTMLPADGQAVSGDHTPPSRPKLERTLRSVSVLTMLMTIPQVLAVWGGQNVGGVSLVSWSAYLIAALLWFVYGLQKRDKTIYLACIGWIVLDGAVVVGVIVRG